MRQILEKYLRNNNHFVPKEDFKLQLLSHPDYPSIKAITDTLDYFKINNIAVNVPLSSIKQLPTQFIALLKGDEGEGYALAEKKIDEIALHFVTGFSEIVKLEDFKARWTGTVIVVEEGEVIFQKSSFNVVYSLLIFLFLIIGFIQITSLNILSSILIVTSIIGLYFSYLIIKEEIGLGSKIASMICDTISKTGNCSDVINSKSGEIFGIALSDYCVVYFSGLILLNSLIGQNLLFSLITAYLTIPLLIFSIYQQAFIIRIWCPLCLAVICIVSVQDMVVFFTYEEMHVSMIYLVKAALIFISLFVAWQLVKPLIVNHLELTKTRFEFMKFKRNQNLFQTLLQSKEGIRTQEMPRQNKLQFGSENAQITIDAITNPLCGYCADSFRAYEKLLNTHSEEVKINFIFNVPLEHPDNIATQIAIYLIELYHTKGKDEAWKAFQEWYNERNIDKWQSRLAVNSNFKHNILEYLSINKEWCKSNEIDYTPATIINGQFYPEEYKSSDLPMVIGDMILEFA